jgi:hypothetical protein
LVVSPGENGGGKNGAQTVLEPRPGSHGREGGIQKQESKNILTGRELYNKLASILRFCDAASALQTKEITEKSFVSSEKNL